MTTLSPSPAAPAPELAAHQGHLRACVRVLEGRGWQQRLQPLAAHMVRMCLVRGPGKEGAPLRRLNGELLREPLSQMLRAGDDEGASSSTGWSTA